MLYWAYGSNLCEQRMKQRCPGAKKFDRLIVPDGALIFRGVADITFREGYEVPGGLWQLTEYDERRLDLYEGVGNGLYLKRYLTLRVNGVIQKCLYYQMSITKGIMPPNEIYLDMIAQGYRDFGLPLQVLDRALQEAWDEKKITKRLQRRRGNNKMAKKRRRRGKTVAFSFSLRHNGTHNTGEKNG